MSLIKTVSSTHIKVVEYFTNKNYSQPEHILTVSNHFIQELPITEEELNFILKTLQDKQNIKYCNTLRGNISVSG